MSDPQSDDLTQLLQAWRDGNESVLERLIPLIYPELRRIAHAYLRRELGQKPLETTELVHELYLRLAGGALPDWDSRTHFYSIAARLIRQILVDAARELRAQKRGSGLTPLPLDDARELAAGQAPDVITVHEALDELASFDERKARILELRYFGGLETAPIAAILEISESTVARELRTAKAWLKAYLSR